MAEQTKKTKTPSIKQITKASDLQGIKPLEEITVKYYYGPDSDPNTIPYTAKGIFGGAFQVDNENYFVLSTVRDSHSFSSMYNLTSYLYNAQEKAIIKQKNVLSDFYHKGSPANKDKDLGYAISKHVHEFTNTKMHNPKS